MRTGLTALLLLAWLCLVGCGARTADEHYARAQAYAEKGESRAAIIELKNALQKNPDFADARLMLGQAHAQSGDFAAALKEFERALDLGLEDEALRLGLLTAKVQLGRHQEVIGELDQQGALSPPFAVVLGDAYLSGGDLDNAKALYQQALGLSGGNLGLGIVAWQQGDAERARHYLGQALNLEPGNLEVRLTQAEFELSQNQFDAAEAAFQKAAELSSGAVVGQVGVARVKLLQGDLEGAAAAVDRALEMEPKFPPARYLSALVRYEQRDLDKAEADVRAVQKAVPGHLPSMYLMGAIQYRQGKLNEAADELERYLEAQPNNEAGSKLLASIRSDQGDFSAVRDLLEPLREVTSDPQILAMYGSAQLRLGQLSEATAALEAAVALAPDMAPFRNQLALTLLSAGEQARAEAELQSALEVDGEQFQSDYLLAMVRLRDEDWDGAAAAAKDLVAKSADSPIGYNLLGAAALGQGDLGAAAGHFQDALDQDPTFLPAVENLSRLAEREGDVAKARALYENLLVEAPGREDALVNLAELALRQGDQDGAQSYLQRALAANPGSVAAGLGLARLQLAAGQVAEAGRTVDQALGAVPKQLDLLLLRAEVDLQSGNPDAASRIATDLQSTLDEVPGSVVLYRNVGTLQARVGQFTLARMNLEKALKLADGADVGILQTLARLDLQDRNVAEARRRLDRLAALGDEGPAFELLRADVRLADGDRRGAIAIYRDLAERDVREGVLRLGSVYLDNGEVTNAVRLLSKWVEANRDDVGAQMLLAEALMRDGDAERAIERYERLVETENPVALNNLAWLYMERGDERAEGIARRAVAAAPDNADVLDTLGWILQRQGDTDEAVKLLRRSAQLKPDDPSVAYHLGIALRDSGDVEGAKRALEQALEAGGFAEAQLAREVLGSLQGS